MYSLYRDKDGFGVRRDGPEPGTAPQAPEISAPRRVKTSRVGYGQWKAFMDKGAIRGPQPDKALLDSWRRCRDMDVDPAPRSCWDFTPMNSMAPFTTELADLGGDIAAETYKAIQGKNLLITITDAGARVARTCGDLSTLRQADRLNFGPGANWAEASVGTNAIGTALATGRPMQVFGVEHFCQSHHPWGCTAAPVFDPLGAVWGCFDISGPTESDHSTTFGLVVGAARELEKRLWRRHMEAMEGRFCSLFSTMFNSVLTGMLSVDARGRISGANGAAESLLGRQGVLRGRMADEFFDFDVFLARQKHDSSRAGPVPLKCLANPRLMAQAAPVFAADGTWCDTVISVSEPQRVKPRSASLPADALREAARPEGGVPKGFDAILFRSRAMAQAIRKAANAARTPSTVLLTGESGTGKELFARGIHRAGPRAGGPFVAVNCGALPEKLIQSELFGYCGGAFTGADRKGRKGTFQQAHKGVLFLDEISEMPLSMQVNLLRALEERAVVPVGGTRAVPVDVKVVAATNRDLPALVAEGGFREDLYYRINVVGIRIPPLRERVEDVPLLAERHARRLSSEFGLRFDGLDPQLMEVLSRHGWPGNVRELFNCVEHAVNTMQDGTIEVRHLPAYLNASPPARGERDAGGFRLKSVEAETIRQALSFHGGNVSRAARALGIGRNTLYAKMQKFGISG